MNHPDKKFTYIFSDYYKNGTLITTGVAKSRNGKTKDGEFVFYHDNGQKLALGQLSKDRKTGSWKYFDNTESEVKKDQLIKSLLLVKYTNNGVSYKGKCLCYNKEGIWEEEDLKTKKISTKHYEDGQQIAVDGIYSTVDDTASYKTGMNDFYKYLAKELKYPFLTWLKGKHGKVFVEFTIDNRGNVTDLKFLKTLDSPTEKKISGILMSTSGRWNPATYRGEKVGSKLVLPIIFELR
ncbi:MAG: energy transducer TonB [Cyclobacteriaceae bacterium]|nr:energy transducer TonB [Cyclobacteriaceae bacterium]